MNDTVTFIIGSPRRGRSTSASIVEHMRARIGTSLPTAVLDASRADIDDEAVRRTVMDSGTIVLVSPLYVDSLPSHVLEMMGALQGLELQGRGFLAVLNCGFPESSHNLTALRVCRSFAETNGMRWLGGAAIGGGGSIDGRPLSASGPERHAVKGLDMICTALAEGVPVPEEAFELASRQFFPAWLYMLAGNRHWRSRAKARGAARSLKHRPYG